MELVPGSEEAVKVILGAGRDQVFEATERLDINPNTLPRLPWDALHDVVGPIWPTDIWLAGAGTGSGKALSITTRLATPDGWTTMGDVHVGDHLFDERGQPCLVTFVTPHQWQRDCFRVVFSDGQCIVADGDHLWETESATMGPGTRTTREILATLHYGHRSQPHANHRIRLAGPLELPAVSLPVPPYVLGQWLGNGHSAAARITSGPLDATETVDHLAEYGVTATPTQCRPTAATFGLRFTKDRPWATEGLQAQLRALGVLGNKHIPGRYLRASRQQRLELLQGLMDTDGYAAMGGECEYCSVSEVLAMGVMELMRTLGLKVGLSVDRARLNGKDCGPRYRIRCSPVATDTIFRLGRKAVRVKPLRSSRSRATWRYIVAIEPVESVPVKCITVDSPSHLYLAGEGLIPTHNTTLLAHIAEALLAGRRRIYVLTLEQTPAELRTAMAALALGYHPQQALQNAWDKMGNDSKRILTNELHRQVTDLEGRLIFSHATTMAEDDIRPELLMAQRFNADLVIIDHLSQIDADGYNGIKRFVKTLKRVVNEVQIPVLVAAQLGRGDRDIMRPYRPPTTYDIEGGEVIAQHMSVAIGLYRPTVPMSVDDERSVRRGQAEMKSFLVPEAMGVSLMKHRVRGDQLGTKVQLRYRHGRITDPITDEREGRERRYGV